MESEKDSSIDNGKERNGLFSASIIADYFLKKDQSLQDDVMKILKLVYISHGFYLALAGRALIKEVVMAWKYGPVIPELYFQLKTDCLQIDDVDYELFCKHPKMQKFLDIIYSKYIKFTGKDLSEITHQKDSPWDITIREFKGEINNNLIKDHYIKLWFKTS